MLDIFIPILILILVIVGITKLNKNTRPDYVKNYSFKRDFIRDNPKLVISISLVIYFNEYFWIENGRINKKTEKRT